MPIELEGLAARLKAGIDRAAAEELEAERRRAEAERAHAAAVAETLDAQREMLEALEALARGVGHFEVTRGALWVQMALGDRGLRFTAVRDDDHPTDRLTVGPAEATATEVASGQHLTRDELGEWEVVLQEEHGPRRLPVELGLEELVSDVLGIAPPEPSPPEPAPQVAVPEESIPEAPPEPKKKTVPRRGRREPAAPPGSGLRSLKGPLG